MRDDFTDVFDKVPLGTIVKLSQFNHEKGEFWAFAVETNKYDYARYIVVGATLTPFDRAEIWPLISGDDDEGEIVSENDVPDWVWAELAKARLTQ